MLSAPAYSKSLSCKSCHHTVHLTLLAIIGSKYADTGCARTQQALAGPEAPVEGAAAVSSSAPAGGADFIPAKTFAGSKLGYVFQSGTQGTGYDKDGVDRGLPPPPTPAGLAKS